MYGLSKKITKSIENKTLLDLDSQENIIGAYTNKFIDTDKVESNKFKNGHKRFQPNQRKRAISLMPKHNLSLWQYFITLAFQRKRPS